MSKVLKTFVFAAMVKQFSGSNERPAEEDKNNLMPVILDVIAGACPNVRVLSGTVAARGGMTVGEGYLIKAVETGETYEKENGEFVPQYNFSTMSRPLSTLETLEVIDKMGAPKVVGVVRNTDEDEEKDGRRGETHGDRRTSSETESFDPTKLSAELRAEWDTLDSDLARADWFEAHPEVNSTI